jgi:2-polyprenyl-3-methyl-5-hydroxy-6-metoxy-1,4-benzoquinol methylase
MSSNEKTELTHWESAWAERPRLKFPSQLHVGTRNVLGLLRPYLRPGLRYLEIGCAPGKILAWVGREVGVTVCGVDYSPTGADTARWLCAGLGVPADIRCEDATRTTFPPRSFDLVFSCGLIEHFEDPSEMVAAHTELLAPGGLAVIAIPNYSGVYLELQQWCDPDNVALHNLEIMSEKGILSTAPLAAEFSTRSFRFGRASPWLISLPTRLGRLGGVVLWGLNAVSLLQPFEVRSLCPLVVLEVRRSGSS